MNIQDTEILHISTYSAHDIW